MKVGTINYLNDIVGMGFINLKDTKPAIDVFVSKSELEDEIRLGDLVAFDLEDDDRGLTAVNVKLVNHSATHD
ncbi:cold shock domain-containing protein [Flammeovirgaceae bacterium SG7u.111]|nr:cold shock domain-containing protein [Flammeovirgaceae bacterium SG7u.132]WPO37956.1 cold shock domain-containing protein [Flammeovirgaceae bacterium SG7u.111]